MEQEVLEDFIKKYSNELKQKHRDNAEAYFNNLVEKSKVDIDGNKSLVKEIRKLESEKNLTQSKKNNFSFLLVLLVVVGVISIIALIVSINNNTISIYYAFLIIGIVLILIFPLIKISKKLKELKLLVESLEKSIDEKTNKAWAQMSPLNCLFENGVSNLLLSQTFPLIEMDKYFDYKRFDLLQAKYKLDDDRRDLNSSVLYCQSGQINGNPFLISCKKLFEMISKRYEGSITISWTTIDHEGHSVTHSETLRASIDRPAPSYWKEHAIYYGNEAAPNLFFTRSPKFVDDFSEGKLERHIKSQTNKLERTARKSIKKGGDLTLLANTDFEVLFNATNRNDEQEFRLLFTPFAQREMVKIIMDEGNIGNGDDFFFQKLYMLNILSSKSLSKADLEDRPSRYFGYEFEQIKRWFISYNESYFHTIYFNFAPLLAIPLYYQLKPREYIYKDVYPSYFSPWQHEEVVNRFDIKILKSPESITDNIVKTKVIGSEKGRDTLSVRAYGFRGEDRVEYVSKFGGDGKYHKIPIKWVEYFPVEKESVIKVANPGLSYQKYRSLKNSNNTSIQKFSPHFTHSILSFLSSDPLSDYEIDNMFDEIEKVIAGEDVSRNENSNGEGGQTNILGFNVDEIEGSVEDIEKLDEK